MASKHLIAKEKGRKVNHIDGVLEFIRHENLYPNYYHIESAGTELEVIIDGQKYLRFCSNNYLGLSTHPEVIAAAKEQIDTSKN